MRGLGQVVGLSLLGALFQELLATQLNARITGPHAREVRGLRFGSLDAC